MSCSRATFVFVFVCLLSAVAAEDRPAEVCSVASPDCVPTDASILLQREFRNRRVNVRPADMILALKNSTECEGSPASFDAGYGGCDSYASHPNKDYCETDFDKKTGAAAAEVCSECGKCTASKTPTPSPSPTPGGASCKSAPGDKKYGPHCPTRTSQEDCETMKPHCQWVKDGEQFTEMSCRAAPGDKKYESICKKQDWEEGCGMHFPNCQWLAKGEEFQKPEKPKPATCKGSYADFDAGWGGCETYASATNGNKDYCGSDADEETGAVAAEVCPECGKCKGANGGGKSPGDGKSPGGGKAPSPGGGKAPGGGKGGKSPGKAPTK